MVDKRQKDGSVVDIRSAGAIASEQLAVAFAEVLSSSASTDLTGTREPKSSNTAPGNGITTNAFLTQAIAQIGKVAAARGYELTNVMVSADGINAEHVGFLKQELAERGFRFENIGIAAQRSAVKAGLSNAVAGSTAANSSGWSVSIARHPELDARGTPLEAVYAEADAAAEQSQDKDLAAASKNELNFRFDYTPPKPGPKPKLGVEAPRLRMAATFRPTAPRLTM